MTMDDTSKESRRVQTEIYRQMPLTTKVKLIFDAYRTGQQLAFAGLRLRHPNASDKQIWYLWAKQHLGEELFKEVYGEVPDD
jgi:hypothetical protein